MLLRISKIKREADVSVVYVCLIEFAPPFDSPNASRLRNNETVSDFYWPKQAKPI
jgi:hypothetical protein